MAKILRPRRGLHSYATSQNIVLNKGEIFFSYDSNDYSGINRIYIGDGSSSISNLTPFINNSSVDYATNAGTSKAAIKVKTKSVTTNANYELAFLDGSSVAYNSNVLLNPYKKAIILNGTTHNDEGILYEGSSSTYELTRNKFKINDSSKSSSIQSSYFSHTGPNGDTLHYADYDILTRLGESLIFSINDQQWWAEYAVNGATIGDFSNYSTASFTYNSLSLIKNDPYSSYYSTHSINSTSSSITYKDRPNSATNSNLISDSFNRIQRENSSIYQGMSINYYDIIKAVTNKDNNTTTGWNNSTITYLNEYLNQITPNEYISVHYAHIAVPRSNDSLHLFNTAAATTTFYNNSSYNFGKNITTATKQIPSFTNSSSAGRNITMIKLNKGFYLISAKIHPTGNINANKVFSIGININSTTQFHQQAQYEVVYIATGAYDGISITHPVYVPNDNSYVWLYGRAEGANFASAGSTHADSNAWISCLRLGGLI